jgi:hypothetical protein
MVVRTYEQLRSSCVDFAWNRPAMLRLCSPRHSFGTIGNVAGSRLLTVGAAMSSAQCRRVGMANGSVSQRLSGVRFSQNLMLVPYRGLVTAQARHLIRELKDDKSQNAVQSNRPKTNSELLANQRSDVFQGPKQRSQWTTGIHSSGSRVYRFMFSAVTLTTKH